MKNTQTKIEECGMSGEMLSYLYRDADDNQRIVFEDHLADCSSCIDEFAELSHARYSVYEWRRDEFAPLATPQFTLPVQGTTVGVLARLQQLVSTRWAAPVLGFAMVAIVAGLVLFSGPQPDLDVASRTDSAQEAETAESSQVPQPLVEASPTLEPVVERDIKSARTIQPPVPAGRRSVVRPAAAKATNRKAVQLAPRTAIQAASAGTDRTPVLSSETETDDRSLRLSDLFDSEGS